MPIPVITQWTGATTTPAPMTTVPPELSVDDEDLKDFAAGSGLNGPFLAGVLSAFVTHERDGINLFAALAATTASPVLKSRYNGFRGDAETAASALSQLITELGGNPNYAGHVARLTEGLDTKLLEAFLLAGSSDAPPLDMLTVQATLIAATVSEAYVDLFDQLTQEMSSDSATRDLIAGTMSELKGPAQEKVAWARQASATMFLIMVQHPLLEGAASKGKDLMRKLQEKLR
jgi:hypothetical protein